MSLGVEWGLHSCHLLAELPPETSLSAGQLAEFFDLPFPYLSKHLQALSRSGITTSAPGPKGGYRLARPPARITLLDVVQAIDGPAPAFRCTEIRQRGPAALPPRMYRHACAIASAVRRAEEAWQRELQAVTIADLMATAGDRAPVAVASAKAWLARATQQSDPAVGSVNQRPAEPGRRGARRSRT